VPSVSDILKCPVKVPTLPMVYTRLLEVMNDSYSSSADVGAVISDDPGLTARLLRLVNSAFYGFPAKIESVNKGLSVVGTQQLHDLALATSVIGMFQDVPEDLVDMTTFWHHSLACGVCARVIATERREPNVERLFVAGLLHDIGRLMIYMKNPDGARESLERSRMNDELLYVAEREVMGYEHATVGEALLETWKLPASLQEPVAYHHKPTLANGFAAEAAIVHVADIMAHAMLMGHSGERFVPPLQTAAWERLEISPSLIPVLLDDVDKQYVAAVQAILRDDE